jgi:hypothetical protein
MDLSNQYVGNSILKNEKPKVGEIVENIPK